MPTLVTYVAIWITPQTFFLVVELLLQLMKVHQPSSDTEFLVQKENNLESYVL